MSTNRTIHVAGRTWIYQIGRCSVVARAQDNQEKRVVDLSKLTGLSWDDIERGIRKRWFKVQPHMIAAWLVA